MGFNKRAVAVIGLFFAFAALVSWLCFPQAEPAFEVLVLHAGDNREYQDTYQHFQQSLISNLRVQEKDITNTALETLSHYQLIYVDASTAGHPALAALRKPLLDYVQTGGSVFMENRCFQDFPRDFVGATSFTPVKDWPEKPDYPQVPYNYQCVQDVLRDYLDQAQYFKNPQQPVDLGVAMVPDQASPLVNSQGLALYTVNKYGQGLVFFASNLLPNTACVNGFDMIPKNNQQKYFTPTVATCSYLLKNEFAALVQKEQLGYVIKKVLGPYGRPAMAWQNHFEVLSAIPNQSMQKWTALLKNYDQIPSFSLARSLYEWGTWKESVVYHINIGSLAAPVFIGEEADSGYGSGRHVKAGNSDLTLNTYPDYKSLGDTIVLPYRSYPSIADLTRDGIPDLVSGSADGFLYLYTGSRSGDKWSVKPPARLASQNGMPINVGAYSSPVLYDINRDGRPDILTGNQSGSVALYLNTGDLRFDPAPFTTTVPSDIALTAPEIGDLNGDGLVDLLLGTEQGTIWYGQGLPGSTVHFGTMQPLQDVQGTVCKAGTFTAPRLYDYNGDGFQELVVGTGSGYIKKYLFKQEKLEDDGFLEGQTLNPNGNAYLWAGHNTVPCIADLNGDGLLDLITGQVEFGLPIPINAPDFPYPNELKEALASLSAEGIELMPHFFVHNYKNPEQENLELSMHRQAFTDYNIPWGHTGVNQHTWRINQLNPTQTFQSELKQDLWWNAGFRPANQPAEPSLGTEYALNIPFRLKTGAASTGMLLVNTAPNLTLYPGSYPAIARWDLPVSYFCHMEYTVQKPDGRKGLEELAVFLDQFRSQHDYNFMTEPQMMKTIAAVLDTSIINVKKPVQKVWEMLRHKSGGSEPWHIHLVSTYHGLQDTGNFQDVVGVKLEIGEALLGREFQTDAPVYCRQGNDLYFSVNKSVNVRISNEAETAHLVRANLPATIQQTDHDFSIYIAEKGLQQLKVYSPSPLTFHTPGWDIVEQDHYYTFTRYGDPATLEIRW